MNRKRRKLLFLLLLIGLPAWWRNLPVPQEYSNAALIAAIKCNDTSAALQALEDGADPNARDLGVVKPSMGQHLRQLWDRLRGRNAPDENDKRYENANKPTALEVLLMGKYDPDYSNEPPPENVQILQALLQRGANLQVTDAAEKMSPLHWACRWNFPASVRLLLQFGAKMDARDGEWGKTPLHIAAQYSTECTRLLLDAGADPNARDAIGSNPLHCAAFSDNMEAVRLLIAKGADVNAKNIYVSTPLHDACYHNQLEIARFLLEHGANVNVKDHHGDTPLEFAKFGHYTAIIRLLKQHGAK